MFIEPSTPTVRRWLKKVDTTAFLGRLADALDAILTSADGVRDVRWWTEEEAAR